MNRGFTFNPGKCVRCNACSAACILENHWQARTREIYTLNENVLPGLQVINFSLACNHCEKPACLDSCPSGCYTRDTSTGAIIINQENCMGCRYCQWNCPYDAPKFDSSKKIIEKCTLCYREISIGEIPSCVSACPTGALGFGELPGIRMNPEWFPETSLNPSILITSDAGQEFRMIPEDKFENPEKKVMHEKQKSYETSLMIFSFLCVISVSIVIASLMKGTYPDFYLLLSFCSVAAISAVFHPGKPFRAWRSLNNLRSSPLSREILFFLLFSGASLPAALFKMPVLMVCSSIAGMILLLVIDNVYIRADRTSWLHSGQTFVTALLLVSFFSASMVPFTFIMIIKVFLSSRMLLIKRIEVFSGLRYIRISVLLLAWAGLVSGFNAPLAALAALVISGEMIDRFLFYEDFQPVNIRLLLNRN